jgi:hypothetical protein
MNSYVFVSEYGTQTRPNVVVPSVESSASPALAYIVSMPEQCDFNIGDIGKIMANADSAESLSNDSADNLESVINVSHVNEKDVGVSETHPPDNPIRYFIRYMSETNIRICNCIITISCCAFRRETRDTNQCLGV